MKPTTNEYVKIAWKSTEDGINGPKHACKWWTVCW